MSYALCCLNLRGCFGSSSTSNFNSPNNRQTTPILLDTAYMGHEVVIVKNGIRICGNGGALASAPIHQNKAYWEVKLQQTGIWGVGLATRNADLNRAPGGNSKDSWVLCNDGVMRNDRNEVGKASEVPNEGDILPFTITGCRCDGKCEEPGESYHSLGMSYDHEELKFYINNKYIEPAMTGIRGTVYPVLFVDDGAILDLCVDRLNFPPPPGFDRIMLEQSLL